MKKIVLIKNSLLQGSGILVLSLMAANGINFVYNAYLGRVLSIENFGLITFINTLWYLLTIVVNAYSSTVNHRSAFLATDSNKQASIQFFRFSLKRIVIFSFFATMVWFFTTPLLKQFFFISDITSLFLFSPLIMLAMITGTSRGFLQGNLYFTSVACIILVEAISKLASAYLLVFFHMAAFAYASIPISVFVAFVITLVLLTKKTFSLMDKNNPSQEKQIYTFPRRFFAAAFLMGISTSGFLTLDLVIVKHFFLPLQAGEYSLLSLAGKMIFFFGSLFNGLLLTFVSRDLGSNKNPTKTLYRFLKVALGMTIFSYFFIGILGTKTVPLLLGSKAIVITPYLASYGLAISFFTIANIFVIYHLARHHYSFSLLTGLTSITMIFGIYFWHKNIGQIAGVLLFVSTLNLFAVILLHFLKRNSKFFLAAIIDFFDAFTSYKKTKTTSLTHKKILVFNWRDTKHKYAGGAEVYIHELAKRWVEKGHQVTLFCGNDGYANRSEIIDGVEIIRRGGFYFVYLWAFIYYLTKFKKKFDVIIDCQNGIPFFTPLYSMETVYCLMFHVHQDVFMKSLSRPMALFASVLENRAMPWIYRKTKFVTISESTKRGMEDLDLGKAGISVVYPGIDLSVFRPGKKHKNPLVLYVGRLKQYKSVDIFIHSAKDILQKVPKVEFVIIGDGEERENLKAVAKKLNIEDKVIFLGKVSEQEKIQLYQKAWVFVNPSMMEGWGITSIEANACGTPVIASNVPGLRDSVKNPHTGYLVEYGDIDEFVRKIHHLITDSKARNFMEKEAENWAKKFTWEKSAIKCLKFILQ